MVFNLSFKDYLLIILLSFATALYTDYIAYTKIGFFICIILVFITIILSLFNFSKALLLAIFLLFVFPVYPRDILTIYTDLQVERSIEFYSILYSHFVGFALAQWLFLILGIVVFYKLVKFKYINKTMAKFIYVLFVIVVLLYISTLLDIPSRKIFSLKEFISDQRYFIILFFGLISGFYSLKSDPMFIEKFTKTLLFIGLIVGVRVILFLIHDIVFQEVKYYFSTLPYLIFPLVLTMIFLRPNIKNLLIIIILFLGSFNISRGDIIYMLLDSIIFILLLIITKSKNNLMKLKRFGAIALFLLVFTILPIAVLYYTNEKLFDFLLMKLQFFTQGLGEGQFSQSTSVRIYEFKNIISGSLYELFFGKGFGGYFTFDKYPFPLGLGISDYTPIELRYNIFYHPHTFINFTLLKGGIIFLLFHLSISFYFFYKGIKSVSSNVLYIKFLGLYGIFYALFSLNSHWLPQYLFFNGILLSIYINLQQNREGKICKK